MTPWPSERLQVLVAAREALLHDISHELRTPLARLQLAIGLAHQNPANLETSLARIKQEAERLDRMVGSCWRFRARSTRECWRRSISIYWGWWKR
ncbi:hypothetical protein SODG_003898 [Sodalis praecaptivus]